VSFFKRGPRKVRVHMLTDGRSLTIEGILTATLKREYVLLTAKVLEDTATTFEATGQIEIPRENVVFLQVLA
jgi:hypothetical protein